MRPIPVYKVSQKVGTNPVARAIAKKRFQQSITDMRIQIFVLDEGEDCLSDLATIYVIVNAVMFALIATHREDSLECRKLRSAWGVLDRGMRSDCGWSKSDTVTLDNALEIAGAEWAKFPAHIASLAASMAAAGKSALDVLP